MIDDDNEHSPAEDPSEKSPPEEKKVGYKNPPAHTRFKPGNPGRPKGSGKRHFTVAEIFATALKRRRKIRRGERVVSMQVAEILIERVIAIATTGTAQEMGWLMRAMDKYAPHLLETTAQRIQVVYHRSPDSKLDLPPDELWKEPKP